MARKNDPAGEWEWRELVVFDTSVLVSVSEAAGSAFSQISILARMDRAVLRTDKIAMIISRQKPDAKLGHAFGVNIDHWRVYASLPDTQYQELLSLTLSGRLTHAQIYTERVLRGQARVQSISFSTKSFD